MQEQDFERENAKEWDTSTVATETPRLEDLEDEAINGGFQYVPARNHPRGRGRGRGAPTANRGFRGTPIHRGFHQSRGSSTGRNLPLRNPLPPSNISTSPSRNPIDPIPPRHKHDVDQRMAPPKILPPRAEYSASGVKSKGWGKLNLETARKTERNRLQSVEGARAKQFLGQPGLDDLGHFGAIAYFLWPYPFDEGSSPSNILGWGLSALHDVRKRFETFIDWDENLHCIRLRSWDQDNAEDALAAVAVVSRHANAGLGVENRDIKVYNVKGPSPEGWRSYVKPQFGSETAHGVVDMRIIKRVILDGCALTDHERLTWIDRRAQIQTEQQSQLEDALTDIIHRMSPLRCGMKLRINFGQTIITKYKKDFAEREYSFDDFSGMMSNSSRLMTSFEKNLGDAQDAFSMVNHIVSNGSDIFVPADWRHEQLSQVEEQHQLVLFIRNRESEKKGELIRVESMLDSPERGSFQGGTTNFFWHDKQVHRLGYHSINLESRLDWCIQLSTTDEITKPSKALCDHVYDNILAFPGLRTDEQGYEYPNVKFKPTYLFDTEGVLLRSIRSYAIKDTPGYALDITIFRRWETSDTRGQPKTSLGLSISCNEWDNDLRALSEDATRTWYSSLRGLLKSEEKEESQIGCLTLQLDRIHAFIDASQEA